jgi:hypothetical protein
MLEQESIPSKISEIIPKIYVPPIVRLRDFVGIMSERNEIDTLTKDVLGKYANMQYRAQKLASDFKNKRISWMAYPVGEEPTRHPEGYVHVYPQTAEERVNLLRRQAFGVFDTYIRDDPKAKLLAQQVDEYIQILFR